MGHLFEGDSYLILGPLGEGGCLLQVGCLLEPGSCNEGEKYRGTPLIQPPLGHGNLVILTR